MNNWWAWSTTAIATRFWPCQSPAEASSPCRLRSSRRLWSLYPCWPSSHWLTTRSSLSFYRHCGCYETCYKIHITCTGLLLVFIDNEYSYFAWKFSLDNQSLDNRGSTVHVHVCETVLLLTIYMYWIQCMYNCRRPVNMWVWDEMMIMVVRKHLFYTHAKIKKFIRISKREIIQL